MSDSLFQISEDYMRFKSVMDELLEDPEVDEQAILDTWESIEMAFDDKIAASGLFILAKEGENKTREALIKNLQNKNETTTNRIKRMKEQMMGSMISLGYKKAGTPICSATVCGNGGKRPLIWADGIKEDPTLLPEKWRTKTEIWKADTEAIRAALEEGEQIPGVELGERGQYLKVR